MTSETSIRKYFLSCIQNIVLSGVTVHYSLNFQEITFEISEQK